MASKSLCTVKICTFFWFYERNVEVKNYTYNFIYALDCGICLVHWFNVIGFIHMIYIQIKMLMVTEELYFDISSQTCILCMLLEVCKIVNGN